MPLSNPFSVTIQSSAAPAWFTGAANLTWFNPVSNWLGASGIKDPLADGVNSGNTGHQSIIIAWCGFGLDQARRTLFSLRNGGHADYYGNEVYSIDFGATSPVWSRPKNASSNSGGNPPAGFPNSSHSYFDHSGGSGRWFSTHTGSGSPSGFTDGNRAWEFNADTLAWINRGVIGNQNSVGNGSSAFNSVTNQLILVGDSNPCVKVYDVAGSNFTLLSSLNQSASFGIEEMVAVDTTNNILLVQQNASSQMSSLSLGNVAAGFSTFTPSGAAQVKPSSLIWDPTSNGFIGWSGTGPLKKLSVTVGVGNRYSAGAFSNVTVGGPVPPNLTQNGMYGKAQLIRDMGNGQGLFIVVPRYANPDVYCAKLPVGGI